MFILQSHMFQKQQPLPLGSVVLNHSVYFCIDGNLHPGGDLCYDTEIRFCATNTAATANCTANLIYVEYKYIFM